MKPAERRARWESLLRQQEESGQSVSAFCRAESLTEATFYQWRKRLRNGDPATSLVPVTVVASSPVEIDLPCGATIKVPCDERSLQQVLNVLLKDRDGC